jgi:hypothetical protein
MRLINKPLAIVCICAAALSGVGVAIAQDGNNDAVPPPAKEVSGGQDVTLSPKEMLEKVRGMIPEMDKLRATVAEQLAEARKKKDVVKALCLDDKVKQMKLATDTAKDRVVDLTSATTQNDTDRSKHEFTVIQVLRERVQTLVAEAQQCIGEETGFVGNSDIVVDIDPAIPDADPSDFPDDPLVSDPPVLSSPTL